MNSALLRLLLLLNRASWRRTLQGMRTVRGALLVLFTTGIVVAMLAPQIWLGTRPELRPPPGTIPPFASPGLLGLVLLTVFTAAGEAAVYFTPAEVDMLFSGPFTRRELLGFKLIKTLLGILVMSAFFSLMMLSSLPYWPRAYLGILLALGMVQFLGMAMALAGQIAAEQAYTRGRRLVLAVLAAAALLGLADVLRRSPGQTVPEILAHLRDSPVFVALLAPFDVFTRAIFAARWFPDFAVWAGASLAIDLALLWLVFRLDAGYIESAATISQKVYERIRRTKQGGGVALPPGAGAARLRVPGLPWLFGTGPLAWRQLLIAMRTSRHMLIATLMIGLMFSSAFFFSQTGVAPREGPPVLPVMGVAMIFYLTFLFSMQLPWAFRGDVDHIDFLKSLPIGPVRIAAGELAGGVVLLTAVQLVLLGALTAVSPSSWPGMLAAAAFCPLFNAMLMALNNGIFLVYPVRPSVGTTFEFQVMGRMMLFMMLQFLLLIPLAGIPAAVGAGAFWLSGYSWPAFAATSWLSLAAELPALVLFVAWAFQRFDVSTETPA
ncbi:MAG: putative ABC exporter domain-containing protein [Isosphaeraceae bacterium]